VLVINVTCGTVTWLVTTVTVVPVLIVCVKWMVVTGAGRPVVTCCGICVIVMVVPGAVEMTTAGAVAAGGEGIRVMDLGTLVQIPGFCGTKSAQMPAR
jgi:hypothetical protein